MLEIIAIVAAAPVSYAVWVLMHEYSHISVAHMLVEVAEYRIKLIPDLKNWTWARTWWTTRQQTTDTQRALIAAAPRLPDVLAAVALPWVVDWPWAVILVGGGVVDLCTGSIGYSPRSDLRIVSNRVGVNPWLLRVGGMTVFAASVVSALLAFCLR